jgi:hypothetical protein
VHIEIENAWSATLQALQSIEARANSAAFDVAIAKAKASEMACAATAECLQMHGGIGMTDEFNIGLFLKRARVDSVLFGDAAFHADRVATMLGYWGEGHPRLVIAQSSSPVRSLVTIAEAGRAPLKAAVPAIIISCVPAQRWNRRSNADDRIGSASARFADYAVEGGVTRAIEDVAEFPDFAAREGLQRTEYASAHTDGISHIVEHMLDRLIARVPMWQSNSGASPALVNSPSGGDLEWTQEPTKRNINSTKHQKSRRAKVVSASNWSGSGLIERRAVALRSSVRNDHPAAHGSVGDRDPVLGKQILDVAKAEAKSR